MSSAFAAPVPATREEALRALGTKDAELRRLVVRALEQAPADTAQGVLSVVLADEDWRVRKEGIQLAHAIAERADVIPVLIEALSAPSEAVALRNAAVEALSGLGALAAPAVEAALASGTLDADGRKLAADVLGGARQPRSVRVLVERLEDEDANVRAAAAEALGWIGGDEALAALVAVLAKGERYLRLVALEGLNRNGAVVPFSQLFPFLGDKILRHAAVAAIARTGDPQALIALVEALGDSSRHVAETAMRALGAMLRRGAEPGEAEEVDEIALRERVESTRAHALRLGGAARQRVLAAASGSDATLRRAALPVLALLADPAASDVTDVLVRALRDPDLADDAEAALAALGSTLLESLIDVAHRGDASSRAAVMSVLPRIARDAPFDGGRVGRLQVIDVLRDGLRDPDGEVVAAAASAFAAALGAGLLPNAADVHALLRIAAGPRASDDAPRSGRAPTAKAAAIALQSLRTLARVRPEAVRPHLAHVDTAGDEAPVVCALLAVAGGPAHVPWLSRAVSAESARTRRAAVEALGQIGGASAAVALGFALTDEVEEVALAAIKALGRARDEHGVGVGVAPLLRLLEAGASEEDRSSYGEAIVPAAVRALGTTGDPGAIGALRPLVESSNVPLACAALEALAELDAPDVRRLALEALAHPSSVVARAALDVLDATLADHGAHDVALVAALAPSLAHPSWEVRRRAIELIARLDAATVKPLLASRLGAETEVVVKEALERSLGDVERRLRPSILPPSDPPRDRGR